MEKKKFSHHYIKYGLVSSNFRNIMLGFSQGLGGMNAWCVLGWGDFLGGLFP